MTVGAESFTRGFSLEATRPAAAEIAALADILPRGTRLFLSAVPAQSFEQHVKLAALTRRAGLEPVAHLPARRFASAAQCSEILSRFRDEADLRAALVLAGDDASQGVFADTLALMRSGALQKAGIFDIGVTGYPEGHPQIADDRLAAALRDKIAEAERSGLKLQIVSQFSFAPDRIVQWLRSLRAQGVRLPVRVGMAGPTSIPALLRFARRCGVNGSLRGLMSGAAVSLLTGSVGPGRIIDALAAARDEIGDVTPHYFSFGGVIETARYARAQSEEAAGPKVMATS